MGGTFSSQYGRNSAWRNDPAAEQLRQQEAERKQNDYRARVVGRRVVVVAEIDCDKHGTVVDVVDGLLSVQLDDEREPHFFERRELAPAT